MTLLDTLNADLKAAMRSGDETKKLTLRGVKAAITRLEKQEDGHTLSDAEIIAVLRKELKQRQDSIAAFQQGNRPDLAAAEEAEMAVIAAYLPASLDADAIRQAAAAIIAELGATGPRDMGKVMSKLMPQLAGRADGRLVNQIVKDLLSGT